jgi:lipopolysaccharide transport system ATP-binding protein
MGTEVAISLNNVSKCFKRYQHPVDRLKEILLPQKVRSEEFWALREIDLEVYRGQTLGIIGQNGSGKSTLLQIIAGTLTPTTGQVRVNGRVSALLELGSGFNVEFTGRQNVFFNGQILGLRQEEIAQKFDQIAAFADIGSFMDQPVKTYSSGMFVRLAFAVAIHVEPDVLIVDEALAVGDIFFQQKCYRLIEEIRSRGTSILFVSHDTQAVVKLCDRAVVLEHGLLKHQGTPADMVAKYTELYYAQFQEEVVTKQDLIAEPEQTDLLTAIKTDEQDLAVEFSTEFANGQRYGCAVGLIEGVAISAIDGTAKQVFQVGEEIVLSIKIGQHSPAICPLNIGFQIKDRFGLVLVGTNSFFLSEEIQQSDFGQPFVCQFRFQLSMFPATYTLCVAVAEHKHGAEIVYDWIESAGLIEVISDGLPKQVGLYFPDISMVSSQLS